MNFIQIKKKAQLLYENENFIECIDFLSIFLNKFKDKIILKKLYINSLLKLNKTDVLLEYVHSNNTTTNKNSLQENELYINALLKLSKFNEARIISELNFTKINSSFIHQAKRNIMGQAESGVPLVDMSKLLKSHYDYSKLSQTIDSKDLHNSDINGIFFLEEEKIETKTKTIIVSGAARSGTTALGNILNISTKVATFIERFNPRLGYHPNMFQDKYLFPKDYQKLVHSKQYDKLREKISNAKYIGDKRPLFFLSWDITALNYNPEDIRIVHIVRNIYDVAYSYNKRAINAINGQDKHWEQSRGVYAACKEINILNKILLKALNDTSFKQSILLVKYEETFSSMNNIENIFHFLEINLEEKEKKDLNNFIEISKKIQNKKRVLTDDQIEIIKKTYDFDLHNEILDIQKNS
jgi:hypothetical protein